LSILFAAILFVLIFPVFVWVIGFLNASFFIPYANHTECREYLEAYGYRFIKFKEIQSDGRFKIKENLFENFFSYKTYYSIDAESITDKSKKSFILILKKSYYLLNLKRKLYFFEV